MGEEVTGNNGILTKLETAIENRAKNGAAATTSGNSSSAATENKRGRGRPRKTEGEETRISGLVSVNEPKAIEIEIPGAEEAPKKKPGRPKGSSSNKPAAKAAKVDSTQIQLLLVTISGVMASRPGMEVWNLSPQEAKQIADPLANIVSKNQAVATAMGEHADAFALVAACFMVFLPKFIMWQASRPKKPKKGDVVHYGTKPTSQPSQPKGQAGGISEPHVRGNANGSKNAHQNFGGQLSDLIPAVGGF